MNSVIENVEYWEVTREEQETFIGDILREIIQSFEKYNSILPDFHGELDLGLKKKFIDALNWKYEEWENPVLFSQDICYIYGDRFTYDEAKNIAVAYFWEEDIDFIIRLIHNEQIHNEWINDADYNNFFIYLSNFPGNFLWIISDRVRKVIEDVDKN